jgi:hypothetical protein
VLWRTGIGWRSGDGADQLRRPNSTGGAGELRLGCLKAYGFNVMRRLVRTCEEETIEGSPGALPTADGLGRRRWRGGARFTAAAQEARAREALELGVKRRGGSGVPWGGLNRAEGAPEGGSPAASPLMATV